jgi:hypothetical protein
MKKLFNKLENWIWSKNRKLKRLIKYVPVIWNSEDFDYRYALELFEMKLEDMAVFMESDKAWSVDSKQEAKRIRMVLRLMEKVYDEDYAVEYLKKLEDIYGEGIMDFEFVSFENSYKLKYNYQNLPNAKEIEEMENKLFLKSRHKQQKAHKLLWNLIEHNIQRWWD